MPPASVTRSRSALARIGAVRGEDQAFRCWQVVREGIQHSVRREVEIPTGVHFESSDEDGERWSFPHISRRLADIRCIPAT